MEFTHSFFSSDDEWENQDPVMDPDDDSGEEDDGEEEGHQW